MGDRARIASKDPPWSALVPFAITLAIGAAVYLWMHRRHVVEYRGIADGCEAEVRYRTHEGLTPPMRFRDRWESGPIELVHGDFADVTVLPGRECRTVRCELVEDGRLVAVAESEIGATCVAWTAR
jgi:hypothetical protein